ncbi:hypothetical protein TNCV_567601 [Trichonephila clavipes]|nr:hypothetical protein TNCV_567601 [Trichonephila clavipes]
MESDDAPECVKQYELVRFKCTAGEDEKVDKQKLEEFKKYIGGLSEEDQGAVLLAVMGPGRPVGKLLLLEFCALIGADCGKLLTWKSRFLLQRM